jgi:hypothetical protein
MRPAIRFKNAFLAVPALALLIANQALHAQADIEFDVPALVGAKEISPSPFANEKVIDIILPISTVISSEYRGNVAEFRFDVSWNRNVYSMFDYQPKTKTVSPVEGLLNVEKDSSRSSGFSFNLNSKPVELASANIGSEIGLGNSTREKYQEVPQHEILVASGSINRGTGAFFRFHPSRTGTLEGSRDLQLAYRVPANWRNGILNVECRARGSRSVVGLWNEPFEVSRSFVVPLYLEASSPSQNLAIDFAKAEQDLRKAWIRFESKLKKDIFHLASTRYKKRSLPEQWPHLLIQSGDDQYLSEFEGYLTREVAVAAGKFVQARASLDSSR